MKTLTTPQLTEPARASVRDWIGLAVLMLPVLLASVDNTVLSFAVPQISRDLNPSSAQLLWLVDVYSLVLAGLLVSMGSLADRFGRLRMLMIGGTGFTIISVLGAFAPDSGWLIAARAGMGFFGAMLMPSTLSLIRNIFNVPSQRRLAVAIWAASFTGGAALGPIVGGVLLEHFWWGSVFLMAVPILLPLLIFAPWVIKESKDPEPGPIDPLSILLSFTAMVPLAFAVKSIASEGLNLLEIVALIIGALSLWLFIRRQTRRRSPMLDLRLFRIPSFSGAVLVNLMSSVSLTGFLFFISQHLQLVLGLSPNSAALVLLPGFALCVVVGIAVAPLAKLMRPVWIIVAGLGLNIIGYAIVALSNPLPIGAVVASFIVLGAGVGMTETLSNDAILSAAPQNKAGAASAISETAYEFGTVLSATILGSLLTLIYRSNLTLPAGLNGAEVAKAESTLGGATDVASAHPSLTEAIHATAQSAFDAGGLAVAAVSAVLMAGTAILALLTLRRHRG